MNAWAMSELVRTVHVLCPVSQARMHLDAYFDEHTHQLPSGEKVTDIMLTAPGFPGGASLQKTVDVNIQRHARPVDAFDTISVDWEVPGVAIYPQFHGILNVEGSDDYNSFSLALRGTYDPPGGFVGEVFDKAIGHRVAEATADHLLNEIRDSIERGFHNVEASKPREHV
jgi:hypothetical protein